MNKGNDRRLAKRISYICEVDCEGEGISRLSTRINDISLTGAFIDSLTCFAPGTVVRLKFDVKGVSIETEAEVRYSMPQIGMGVHFLRLTSEQRAALESLIEGKPLVLPEPPEQAVHKTEATGAGAQSIFMGNLAMVNLLDAIQMIENSRMTGALRLNLPGLNGEIQFNSGLIAGALADGADGASALTKFINVHDGTFEFIKSDEPYNPTIQTRSNMGLLTDMMRVKAEESAAPSRD
jgi:hypothetical protein